jgi:hypothetical protein
MGLTIRKNHEDSISYLVLGEQEFPTLPQSFRQITATGAGDIGLESIDEEVQGAPIHRQRGHDMTLTGERHQADAIPIQVLDQPAGFALGSFEARWICILSKHAS